MGNHAVKVSLEYLPVDNGKKENSPSLITKSVSTIATNTHQHSVNKTFSSTDAIGNTIKFSDYNNYNNLVFSRPGLVLVNSSLGDEDENYNMPKGVRDDFFDVYAYLRGQFLDSICVANASNKIDCLKLTIQILGGGIFFNLWGDVYNMRYLQQPFNAHI